MIVTRIVTKPVLESEIYCDRKGKDKKGTDTVFLLFYSLCGKYCSLEAETCRRKNIVIENFH